MALIMDSAKAGIKSTSPPVIALAVASETENPCLFRLDSGFSTGLTMFHKVGENIKRLLNIRIYYAERDSD